MCRELEALRQSIVTYAKGFDAHALIPSQAGEVVRLCAEMVASLESVKSLAASVAAEGNSWKDEGYRSPAEQLAAQTGTTTGRAKQILETGRRLAKDPQVAQAALAGELSPEEAATVADAAEDSPDDAKKLIDKAKTSSLAELKEEAARIKAAKTDPDDRRKRRHAERRLRIFKDLQGAFHAHVAGHPEDGATLYRVITTIRRRLNMLAREEGRFETFEALDYDALMTVLQVALGQDSQIDLRELVELGLFPQLKEGITPFTSSPAPTSAPELPIDAPAPSEPPAKKAKTSKKLAGSPPKVNIRVDLPALLRGVPLEGELCEIDGFGPVPVSVIEGILAQGGIVAALLTNGKKVLSVYHHRRRPNAHQKTALDFIYPTCAVKGCNARSGLQSDHREDWARTHFTALDLLDQLCPHHHRLKTEKNWALVEGHGKRRFVPPDDSMHPSRRC